MDAAPDAGSVNGGSAPPILQERVSSPSGLSDERMMFGGIAEQWKSYALPERRIGEIDDNPPAVRKVP